MLFISLLVGNVAYNCSQPFFETFGIENQGWANWFEQNATVPETLIGANYYNSQLKLSGADVNITRNVTVNGLRGSGSVLACLDASGKLYRGNATGCP